MEINDVWNTLSEELNHEILEAACTHEKKLYRHLVNDMSANLRKRPKKVLEIPRKDRHKLFQPLLGLPQFYMLAQNLVINWLGKTEEKMLVSFLDHLGIEHDGTGCAEQFPSEIEKGKLEEGVKKLYDNFSEEKVTVYLRVFERISGINWPSLKPLIRKK